MLALTVPTAVPVPAPLCPAHSLPQPSLPSPQLLGQKVPLSYQQSTLSPTRATGVQKNQTDRRG